MGVIVHGLTFYCSSCDESRTVDFDRDGVCERDFSRIASYLSSNNHAETVERAFSAQAASDNASTVAKADEILQIVVDHATPKPGSGFIVAIGSSSSVAQRRRRSLEVVSSLTSATAPVGAILSCGLDTRGRLVDAAAAASP